ARIWDTANGRELLRLPHKGRVMDVVFSPDGQRLATTSSDKTARLWDIVSGRELIRLPHENEVLAVVFSPDGKFLATTSNANTARLWDAASGEEFARFPHEGAVLDVVFTRDGQRLATGSADKTAQIWIWQIRDLITETCKRLQRNLTHAEWRQYLDNEPYRATCPEFTVPKE
ncbi:MAG: WD40 repeat domain-containing protein, partial [Gammaproteobacteria bacterium]